MSEDRTTGHYRPVIADRTNGRSEHDIEHERIAERFDVLDKRIGWSTEVLLEEMRAQEMRLIATLRTPRWLLAIFAAGALALVWMAITSGAQ